MLSSPTDSTSITYYIQAASVPEVTIKDQSVAFLSQEFVVPGHVSYGGSWDVTLLTTNNLRQYQALKDWMESFANLQSNGGRQQENPVGGRLCGPPRQYDAANRQEFRPRTEFSRRRSPT